jgi:hypothetical protein
MPLEGCDYSSGYPSVAELRAAGKQFVVRYARGTPTFPKGITRPEVDQWKAAGVPVAIVDEVAKDRALLGRDKGVDDANAATDAVITAGGPSNTVIYMAVDFDATPAQTAGPVRQFIEGAVAAVGWDRVGVYGSYRVVKYMLDQRVCRYGFQTAAWSGGLLDPRANLYQYRNSTPTSRLYVGTTEVDYDRAYTLDYGQWGAHQEDDMPYTDKQLRDIMIGAVCASFRLPEPGNTQGYQPGMGVPAGQTHNGNFFPGVWANLSLNARDATNLKNAVAAVQAAVGAQADDEKVTLAAIAALPAPVGMTDDQIRDLADELSAGLSVDPEKIAAAIRLDLATRLADQPSTGGSTDE